MRKLKELREKAVITLASLGDEMGVAANTVWRWEAGLQNPRNYVLRRLSVFFNCTIDELLSDEGTPPPAPAAGAKKPSGILAPLKESVDPVAKTIPELVKTYAELSTKDPTINPEAAKQAQILWGIVQPFLQPVQGGAPQGASGIPAAGSGTGAGSVFRFPNEVRQSMRNRGVSEEKIAAEERRRSGM